MAHFPPKVYWTPVCKTLLSAGVYGLGWTRGQPTSLYLPSKGLGGNNKRTVALSFIARSQPQLRAIVGVCQRVMRCSAVLTGSNDINKKCTLFDIKARTVESSIRCKLKGSLGRPRVVLGADGGSRGNRALDTGSSPSCGFSSSSLR